LAEPTPERPADDACERRLVADYGPTLNSCLPMNDDERRRIRYGHYLGWFERCR